MKTALILHGTLGSPEGNWFRWLEAELKAKGYTVWLPQLPNASQPSLKEWADYIHQNTQNLTFLHSDNDPYVPLDQAKFVADNCNAELKVIPGQGHFNLEQSPAYKVFPKLLELL